MCGEAELRGRVVVVVVVRGEREAAWKREREMKTVVRVYQRLARGRAALLATFVRPWPGGEGGGGRRADFAERRKCAGGWWLLCAPSVGPPGKKRERGNYRDVRLVPEAGTKTFCATGNLRCALGRAGRKALRSRGLCGEAEVRGRVMVVVVVRGEREAGWKREREMKTVVRVYQRLARGRAALLATFDTPVVGPGGKR